MVEPYRSNSANKLLTLNIFHTFSCVSIVDLEQVNVCWRVNGCFQKQISVRLKLFIEVEDFFLV